METTLQNLFFRKCLESKKKISIQDIFDFELFQKKSWRLRIESFFKILNKKEFFLNG